MGDPANKAQSEEWLHIQKTTAPALFATLQQILLEDVIMSIAKVADPPDSPVLGGRRRNLSLRAIALDEANKLEGTRRSQATELSDAFLKAAKPLITWRKWRIAHDDYLVAIGQEKLPDVTDSDIDAALKSAADIMVLLDADYMTKSYAYDGMIALGDGESLKHALRMAAQYRKECLARGVRPLSEAAKANRGNRP